MLKAWVTIVVILFLLGISSHASALLRLEPENPSVGQEVRLYYYDCEPPTPHIETNELFYIEQTEDLIQFVGFYSFSLPLCPIRYEQYYDLGTFVEGEYELEVYLFLADQNLPINLEQRTPNEIINFGVTKPVSIPATSKIGVIMMLTMILAIVSMFIRKI